MPKKGRHPDKALTSVAVRQAKTPGRYTDGNGLYLVVDPSGAKRWLLRVVVHGRRRDIGLGGVAWVTLAEAREQAQRMRQIAREGGDPLLERSKAAQTVPTFSKTMETVHDDHKAGWSNAKHGQQWLNTLNQYAVPHIGHIRIDQIETPDVLRVLSPIWLAKPETARRVRQRIGTVMDWAKASGYRTGDNPVDGVTKGLPKQPEKVKHHPAMPYTEVPQFLATLKASNSNEITKLAFEFLILTASRTSEVLGAEWSEVDVKEKLWTVPARRMKAKRTHRVPLNARCVEILTEAKRYSGNSTFVFPGRSDKASMSNMVFTAILRSMSLSITTHGFRSSFRDWAAECTSHPREIAEMALAHTIENKVEAAYRRGDLLAKRQELMEDWGEYVCN